MRCLALPLAVLLLSTAGAAAADDPAAYALAQRGSLKVVANVLLAPAGGEMKGVWLDAAQRCVADRTLRVEIHIDLVGASGKTTRIVRSRRGSVRNCSEGGPNFGFDLVPRTLGLGCSGGRWRPGRYSMTTRVTELRSGLAAAASLYRQVIRSC